MVFKDLWWLIVLMVFSGIVLSETNFEYQPYPVLLVHGFNATPKTFGAYTNKEDVGGKDAKWQDIMSTLYLDGHFGNKEEDGVNFSTDHTAYSLTPIFAEPYFKSPNIQ